jgi:uncharacterized membrane protein YecN with MAPEG domain
MNQVGITALYAGIGGLLLLFLAGRVAQLRLRHSVLFGTGQVVELERAIRVHGNAVEYVPLGLLLLLIAELGDVGAFWLHLFGLFLVGGRALHAYGLSRFEGTSLGRVAGISLTWIAMLGLSLSVLSLGL